MLKSEDLINKVKTYNKFLINLKRNIVDRMPSLKRVTNWIEDSKDIEIKVSS